MSQIPISKDGLESHLVQCEICNGVVNGLTLGVLYKAEFQGRTIYADRDHRSKTNREVGEKLDWIHVEEGESITIGLCDKCEGQQKLEKAAMEKEVQKGGIYFACHQCHRTGVIKAEHQLAELVRNDSGVKAPDPIGVEFNACKEHGAEPPKVH